MADLTKSAGALIAEVRAAVSQELLESLRPIVKKMSEAAEDLERVLGGKATTKVTRPDRKLKAVRAETKPKIESATKVARGKRSINPRGSMPAVIREALQKAKGGLRLSDLRDRVLEDKHYQGRDKLALYRQIVGAIKVMTDVVKNADKSYTIASTAGGAKATATKGKKPGTSKRAKPSKTAAGKE